MGGMLVRSFVLCMSGGMVYSYPFSLHPFLHNPTNQVKRLSLRLEVVRPILKLIAKRADILKERDEVCV